MNKHSVTGAWLCQRDVKIFCRLTVRTRVQITENLIILWQSFARLSLLAWKRGHIWVPPRTTRAGATDTSHHVRIGVMILLRPAVFPYVWPRSIRVTRVFPAPADSSIHYLYLITCQWHSTLVKLPGCSFSNLHSSISSLSFLMLKIFYFVTLFFGLTRCR